MQAPTLPATPERREPPGTEKSRGPHRTGGRQRHARLGTPEPSYSRLAHKTLYAKIRKFRPAIGAPAVHPATTILHHPVVHPGAVETTPRPGRAEVDRGRGGPQRHIPAVGVRNLTAPRVYVMSLRWSGGLPLGTAALSMLSLALSMPRCLLLELFQKGQTQRISGQGCPSLPPHLTAGPNPPKTPRPCGWELGEMKEGQGQDGTGAHAS